MKHSVFFGLILGIFLVSCSKQQNEVKTTKSDSSFQEIYELSEMALLMEKMFDELQSVKPKVISAKEIGLFPDEFSKIHIAEMTPEFSRTEEFNRFANLYLQNLRVLYEDKDTANRIANFNNVVNSCIVCHKSDAGCMGPVSRINKLFIKEN